MHRADAIYETQERGLFLRQQTNKHVRSQRKKFRSDQKWYLSRNCYEDEFTQLLLVPLFQRLGFRRVSVTGHTEKLLEYGKDLWMKYQLPTVHWILNCYIRNRVSIKNILALPVACFLIDPFENCVCDLKVVLA